MKYKKLDYSVLLRDSDNATIGKWYCSTVKENPDHYELIMDHIQIGRIEKSMLESVEWF